jgi:Flp pilus assembly protein TadD
VPEALAARRAALAARQAALAKAQLTWHREEAASSERAGQWFAAVFHLNRLLEAEPADALLHLRRGYALGRSGDREEARRELGRARELKVALPTLGSAYAGLGLWEDATATFAQAVEARDANVDTWYCHALLRLQRGDRDGYRKACAAMLERFGDTADPAIANGVAWTCALAPQAVDDLTRPVGLAEKAAERAPKEYALRNTLGAILVRAEKPEAAVLQLEEAVKLHGQGGTPADCLFLVLAHHRLGHAEAAKQWLNKAVQGLAQAKGLPLTQQLEYQLLRREAEALVKEMKP